MLLPEVTVAFILASYVVISLPNILFDMINDVLLFVNGSYTTVIKRCTLPSIIIKSRFKY